MYYNTKVSVKWDHNGLCSAYSVYPRRVIPILY